VEGVKLPRLYLRDLFWLILVIAMGFGWWAHVERIKTDRMYQARLVEALALALTESGGAIAADSGDVTRISLPKSSPNLLELNASVPVEEFNRTMRGEFKRELTVAERTR